MSVWIDEEAHGSLVSFMQGLFVLQATPFC